MQNLRDKLLKAGLVSEDQAQKAAHSNDEPKHKGRSSGGPTGQRAPSHAPPPARANGPLITARPQPLSQAHARGGGSATLGSAIPKLPPLPGSKAHQRLESKKQVELDRALRELVMKDQVAQDVGATVFYFVTRKGKLRRLELTEDMAKKLEKGELAVVERPDPDKIDHALVPAATGEVILERFPKAVRFFNRPQSPVGFLSEDDIRTREQNEADGIAPPEADDAEPEAAPAVEPAPPQTNS